jgi:hypothetical protein
MHTPQREEYVSHNAQDETTILFSIVLHHREWCATLKIARKEDGNGSDGPRDAVASEEEPRDDWSRQMSLPRRAAFSERTCVSEYH